MKKNRILAVILAGALLAGTLSACSGSSSTNATQSSTESVAAASAEDEPLTATLTVWASSEDQQDDNSWLPVMCEKFKEEHPKWDLTFQFAVCAEADAGTMVLQDPSSAGDVYLFANDQLNALVSANAISELGGKTLEDIKANNDPSVVNSVTLNGAVYGVPFTTNTWYMFYNKSMLSEDDVKNLDTMLSKAKISYPLSVAWYLPAFYIANGGTMYGPNGTDDSAGIQFGGDAGTAVTKYLVKMASNPNFVNDADGSGLAGIRDGSIAAMFSGSWDATAVKEALGDNFGVAVPPTITIDGQQKQLKSMSGSKAIAVNPNCKYPQVAVALASFLGSAEAQKSHYELRNIIPCNTEVLKDSEIQKDPVVEVQNETCQSKYSIVQPFVPSMSTFWTPAGTFGSALANHEVTESNAAQRTEEMNQSFANPVS